MADFQMRIRDGAPYGAGNGDHQAMSITPTAHDRPTAAAPRAVLKAEPLLRAKDSGIQDERLSNKLQAACYKGHSKGVTCVGDQARNEECGTTFIPHSSFLSGQALIPSAYHGRRRPAPHATIRRVFAPLRVRSSLVYADTLSM